MADTTGVAAESPRLFGLAHGAWDSARKVLNQVEQHLGVDVSEHEAPTELEDLVRGSVEILTRIMAHLDVSGALHSIKEETGSLLEHAEDTVHEEVSAAERVVDAAERVLGRHR